MGFLCRLQMPFLPENELNKSCSFIEKFYHHLRREGATMEMEDGTRLGGKEQLETYKYIFNSSLDWTGPLNYFRNFMFYRVKANLSVE
jgi:epoxide hydrolase 4